MADPGSLSASLSQVTTTAGLGAYTLDKPIRDKLPISDGYITGDTLIYHVTDASGQMEVVHGTFTTPPDMLTRNTLILSSTGSFIDWPSSGQRIVTPIATLPICDTPPLDKQVLEWDAAQKKYCPATLPSPPIICPTAPLDGQVLVWSEIEQAYCPADFCTLVTACSTGPPPPPGDTGNVWNIGSDYTFRYDYLSVGFVSPTVTVGPFSAGAPASGMYTNRYFIAQICSVGNPAPTVVNVTDTAGLTWTKRTAFAGDVMIPGNTVNMEIWWADCTSMAVGATTTATATYTSPATMPFMRVTEVSGTIKLSSPWDTNVSLPVKHTGTELSVQCPGVSTSPNCGLLMAWFVGGGNFVTNMGFDPNPRNLVGNPGIWSDTGLAFSMIDMNNNYMWPDLIYAGFPNPFVPNNLSNYTAVPFATTNGLDTNPRNAQYMIIVDGIAGS